MDDPKPPAPNENPPAGAANPDPKLEGAAELEEDEPNEKAPAAAEAPVVAAGCEVPKLNVELGAANAAGWADEAAVAAEPKLNVDAVLDFVVVTDAGTSGEEDSFDTLNDILWFDSAFDAVSSVDFTSGTIMAPLSSLLSLYCAFISSK